jgi:hypothetical protein
MNVHIPRFDQDETLPNFIKRKHPRKGEKNKQGARTEVLLRANSPKEGGHKEEREPLITETSTSCLKYINFF